MEPQYDTAVDIWSLGCVLAELLKVTEPYLKPMENLPRREMKKAVRELVDDRHLILSDSCFPLSPRVQNEDLEISGSDQLMKINKVLGVRETIKERNSFVSDVAAQQYHECLLKKAAQDSDGKTLADRFPHTDKQLVQLLEAMLEYNPIYRPSAIRLLSMQLFDDVRLPKLERWHNKFAKHLKLVDGDCERF